eukprot:gene1948-1186_t
MEGKKCNSHPFRWGRFEIIAPAQTLNTPKKPLPSQSFNAKKQMRFNGAEHRLYELVAHHSKLFVLYIVIILIKYTARLLCGKQIDMLNTNNNNKEERKREIMGGGRHPKEAQHCVGSSRLSLRCIQAKEKAEAAPASYRPPSSLPIFFFSVLLLWWWRTTPADDKVLLPSPSLWVEEPTTFIPPRPHSILNCPAVVVIIHHLLHCLPQRSHSSTHTHSPYMHGIPAAYSSRQTGRNAVYTREASCRPVPVDNSSSPHNQAVPRCASANAIP